ncbi:MAG: DUF1566 domain-containing protein [Nitrospinaceae bacterium]|nr:DUF1566 domain-containing protein [Nitrospinaceae bacterium]NIR54833.1 DUF1566 domain-containing protein [Nitrospinaceae bacterium]NIS85258.1 DUF1566 domain-containing protein [Nitrospinaceae bacterium]NIT82071.1 DUF1566 domain-containing protein [Nitrospinaceae bacterium]NIU44332.1 DUF1566 domain-containing protein [Nitrospinaceae bacterium]
MPIHPPRSGYRLLFRISITGWAMAAVFLTGISPGLCQGILKDLIEESYEAPPWVPPPPPPPKVIMTDNRDGTLTDDKGLMWTRKDSYADLGTCLNWYQSTEYVKQLKTGGYTDWRMPTIEELSSIYDDTKDNFISWDHNPENPLHLDKQFADGAAYWYWSSPREETELTDCCARSFYFVNGMVHVRRLTICANGGVRAVRIPK